MEEEKRPIPTPIIEKLTEMMILIALLERGASTNIELADYLGMKMNNPKHESTISVFIKRLEEAKHITVSHGGLDQRKNTIRLTPIGEAQAHLARMSLWTVEGRDDLATDIIKFGQRLARFLKGRAK